MPAASASFSAAATQPEKCGPGWRISARHSMVMDTAMRPMFTYLKAQVVPTGVFAASEDWGTGAGLDRRIERAGKELADLMVALPRRREADPFDESGEAFLSFEQISVSIPNQSAVRIIVPRLPGSCTKSSASVNRFFRSEGCRRRSGT